MVSDPATHQFEREFGWKVAPAPSWAGGDVRPHDQPEIPQQKAHSDEYKPNQRVWCSGGCSRFAVGSVAGFDG